MSVSNKLPLWRCAVILDLCCLPRLVGSSRAFRSLRRYAQKQISEGGPIPLTTALEKVGALNSASVGAESCAAQIYSAAVADLAGAQVIAFLGKRLQR
jgi:hypothetical protein